MHSTINLLCGIGMFLIGMTMMSDSVGKVFKEKLRYILEMLTGTKYKGVLTGLFVTGIIQSSSAVTVMAVGFVDCGVMCLSQAVGVIMGANIGTTVTSLLIAFNFSAAAPLAIFFGTVMKMFSKSEKAKAFGMLCVGFGLLFVGMNTMSSSFESMKENESFLRLISSSESKIMSVFWGFIMTAIMQSSSATVGILQALALQGIIGTESCLYIVLGQNIGAVIPVILSGFGRSKGARQVGRIHLLFNLIGTVIFMVLLQILPGAKIFNIIENPSMRISLFHIAFNVISTVILLPFSDLLIKLSDIRILVKRKLKASPNF